MLKLYFQSNVLGIQSVPLNAILIMIASPREPRVTYDFIDELCCSLLPYGSYVSE